MDCIFCKILNNELPSTKVFEDELCVVIKDIYPQAPIHLLVIPKTHISSISEASEEHQNLLGHLVLTAKKVAQEQGLAGYKLLWNVNKEGGQVVFHIHLHILGDPSGKPLHFVN